MDPSRWAKAKVPCFFLDDYEETLRRYVEATCDVQLNFKKPTNNKPAHQCRVLK